MLKKEIKAHDAIAASFLKPIFDKNVFKNNLIILLQDHYFLGFIRQTLKNELNANYFNAELEKRYKKFCFLASLPTTTTFLKVDRHQKIERWIKRTMGSKAHDPVARSFFTLFKKVDDLSEYSTRLAIKKILGGSKSSDSIDFQYAVDFWVKFLIKCPVFFQHVADLFSDEELFCQTIKAHFIEAIRCGSSPKELFAHIIQLIEHDSQDKQFAYHFYNASLEDLYTYFGSKFKDSFLINMIYGVSHKELYDLSSFDNPFCNDRGHFLEMIINHPLDALNPLRERIILEFILVNIQGIDASITPKEFIEKIYGLIGTFPIHKKTDFSKHKFDQVFLLGNKLFGTTDTFNLLFRRRFWLDLFSRYPSYTKFGGLQKLWHEFKDSVQAPEKFNQDLNEQHLRIFKDTL